MKFGTVGSVRVGKDNHPNLGLLITHHQGIIKREYDRMAKPEGFVVMDATRSIEDQQESMRSIVEKALGDYQTPISSKQIMIPPIKLEVRND